MIFFFQNENELGGNLLKNNPGHIIIDLITRRLQKLNLLFIFILFCGVIFYGICHVKK